MKSSQDLDIQIINFIINTLLVQAGHLDKQFEQELVCIIDEGCNKTTGTLVTANSGLSQYCFSNLF